MAYQALYRVWRSQTFDDVIGQQHITKTLQNAIAQKKISHAYLFSGPRGTGKTSCARILAKAINCENSSSSEPCNDCPTCVNIMEGSATDVLEIDAASNNGVEEIRDLRDKVKYVPTSMKYKVYIIDEVHMLSTGAFNALLKTLEEPPAHVVFILATTEPHKIPLTIHSRCQRYDFKQITIEDIIGRMEIILKETNIAYEENALPIIARAANGGMRDALSLLDQAISYSYEKVTESDALLVTGSVSKTFLINITKAIFERKTADALNLFNELFSSGKDPMRFIEEMIFFYRDILLYQVSSNKELEAKGIDEEFITLTKQLSSEQLYHYIEQLNKTIQDLKVSSHARIFLEVALVKLCQPIQAVDNGYSELINKLEEKVKDLETVVLKLKQTGFQTTETKPIKKMKQEIRNYKYSVSKLHEILAKATSADRNLIKKFWDQVKQEMKNQKESQSFWLDDAEPIAASPNAFVLKFKDDFQCQLTVQYPDFIQRLSEAVQSIIGIEFDIICISEPEWLQERENFLENTKKQQQKNENKQTEQRIEKEPVVEEAINLFGSDLVEIID
ncbi:MAG: dnaX [Bacillales bacterium]|jgi:DNA polymerase-3 subunit gamma/tau|nr:dnaX [Bacillales bacterium]